ISDFGARSSLGETMPAPCPRGTSFGQHPTDMTLKSDVLLHGADVHLDPSECELLIQLACNAEKVNCTSTESRAVYTEAQPSYLSVSLALGRRLLALSTQSR